MGTSRRSTVWRLVAAVGSVASLGIGSTLLVPASSTTVDRHHRAPVVTRLLPRAGPTDGRHVRITVLGEHFRHVQRVMFGHRPGTNVWVVSAHTLRVTAPRGEAGTVRVRVVTRAGGSHPGRASRFMSRELPVRALYAEAEVLSPGSITLRWRASLSFDADKVVIRRAVGRIAPSSPHDGESVGRVSKLQTEFVDHGRRRGQRYTYALFSRSRSGVFSRATNLVTWIPRRTWVGREIDPLRGGGLWAVSCVASGFCAVGDGTGNIVTYDDSTWSLPVHVLRSGGVGAAPVTLVYKMSCGSSSFCVAATSSAGPGPEVWEVSYFNGTTWSDSQPLGNGLYGRFGALSCAPGTTTCVGALSNGGLVHYDGSTWSTSPWPGGSVISGLSCPTITYCLAIADNVVYAYSQGSWSGPATIDGADHLTDVSCVGEADCVVVGHAIGGGQSGFRLQGVTWKSSPLTGFSVDALACITTTWCLAVGGYGKAATFDGAAWSEASPYETGYCNPSSHNICNLSVVDLACVTPTECVGLANTNPTDPDIPFPPEGAVRLWQGSTWGSVDPDPNRGAMTDISCASPTFCTAVDRARNALSFDGTTWSSPVRVDSGLTGARTAAVSCPSARFCAAIFGNGVAATFDGSTWSPFDQPVAYPVQPSTPGRQDVECLSATFCVAIAWTRALTFDGAKWSIPKISSNNRGLFDVSCPTATWCVMVDGAGHALTFDGRHWSPPRRDFLGSGPSALSCPTTSFCLAVAGSGRFATWNGRQWSRGDRVDHAGGYAPGRPGFSGVSCATPTVCTAFDSGGAVHVFDGTTWSAAVHVANESRTSLDQHLTGIDCPTVGWCQTVSDQNAYISRP